LYSLLVIASASSKRRSRHFDFANAILILGGDSIRAPI